MCEGQSKGLPEPKISSRRYRPPPYPAPALKNIHTKTLWTEDRINELNHKTLNQS